MPLVPWTNKIAVVCNSQNNTDFQILVLRHQFWVMGPRIKLESDRDAS
jgi:hypothetical protein